MSNTAEKISITVTPAMKRTLEERVASGQFASASELMREAFRTWQRREDEHAPAAKREPDEDAEPEQDAEQPHDR